MKLFNDSTTRLIALDILTKVYANAPNITWVLKPGERNLRFFFAFLIDDVIQKKGAYITDNKKGVLFLYNLENRNISLKAFLNKFMLTFFILGIKKSIQLIHLQNIQKSIRPKVGLYAMALAIENEQHKYPTGLEIKRDLFTIQELNNLPVYAETTNPRYVRLYEAIGFIVYKQIPHPYTNLNIWFLKLERKI